MRWQDSIPPAAPQVTQRLDGQHLYLEWSAVHDADGPVRYNVYRLDPTFGNVLLSVRTTTTHYDCTLALPALHHSRYVVTAVDVYGNESGGE